MKKWMVAGVLALAPAASAGDASGSLVQDKRSLTIQSAYGYWNPKEPERFEIFLLPFRPDARELELLKKGKIFEVVAHHASPDPKTWPSCPRGAVLVTLAKAGVLKSPKDVAQYTVVLNGVGAKPGPVNHMSGMLPATALKSASGTPSATDKKPGEVAMILEHAYKNGDGWKLDLKATIYPGPYDQNIPQKETASSGGFRAGTATGRFEEKDRKLVFRKAVAEWALLPMSKTKRVLNVYLFSFEPTAKELARSPYAIASDRPSPGSPWKRCPFGHWTLEFDEKRAEQNVESLASASFALVGGTNPGGADAFYAWSRRASSPTPPQDVFPTLSVDLQTGVLKMRGKIDAWDVELECPIVVQGK